MPTGSNFLEEDQQLSFEEFTGFMSSRLKEESSGGDWVHFSTEYLLSILLEKISELVAELRNKDRRGNLLLRKAADVANMALKISDKRRLARHGPQDYSN